MRSTEPASNASRPDATDRLRSIYKAPGPYVSGYLQCGDLADVAPIEVFENHRQALRDNGATAAALAALEARLHLPVPDDVGGWSIHAASDGSTIADFAAEGPTMPVFSIGALPMAAPLIEWDQWRVPHVVASVATDGTELVTFVPGSPPQIVPASADMAAAASHCRQLAVDEHLRLIVITGENALVHDLLNRTAGIVPPRTRVVAIESEADAETIADTTVRHVADVVARDTVQTLEDFRFLEAGGRTVEGMESVFAALAAGRVERLLIHDDPSDLTLASFGPHPITVSADGSELTSKARRADVAIWSATMQRASVRIIPTTGGNGPAENIGAVLTEN